MSGTVLKYGRPVSGPEVDIGTIGNGQQRSCIYDAHPGTVIVYALGAWIGEAAGGTPYARIAMGDVNSGDVPGDVLAVTAEIQPAVAYTDITGGDDYVANVSPFVHGPERFALTLTARNGSISHSMREAAAIGASNRNFYDKAISGSVPTDPLGGSPAYNGHASLWFVCEPSVKPNKPTGLTPVGTISGAGLTPVLTSVFSDPNEILNNGEAFDYLNRYQVKVVRASDGATMWAPSAFVASTTERNNGATSRTYAGSTLSYNTAYTYLIRHEDRTGLWSDWASVAFTLASLSSVERPTSPAGFKTSTANPGNITAVYRHGAMLNANAMQARLLSSAGAVIATSAVFPVNLAANGTLALTWAASGFAAYVQNGGDYGIQVRARDTNNAWSPAWSPVQSFRFNAAPGTPVHLWPDDNRVSSERPRLICDAIDPDPEHPHPLPNTFAEILDDDDNLLQTRAMSYNAADDFYFYQTTPADLPSHGAYKWRSYSFDGYLYSGGATAAAAAARSPVAEFVYAIAPAVTITGPASPIATTTPAITWTSTNQTHYRVRLFHPDTDELVYDSGTVASSAQLHVLAPGGWQGGERWNSGETFEAVVSITDTTTLTGDSDPYPILLEYTPPAALGVAAYLHTLSGTHGTNAVRLEIEQTSYASDQFEVYVYERTELMADGVTERAGSTITLAEVEDPAETILLDAEVTSGQLYRYDVYQRITQGEDTLRSAVSSVTSVVEWNGLILHAPADPEALHLELRSSAPGERWETPLQLGQTMRSVTPVSGGRVTFFGTGETHDPSGTFTLRTDTISTADAKYEALMSLYRAQRGGWDGRPHIICWREGRGGPNSHLYGLISEPEIVHRDGGRSIVVSLKLIENTFVLGVS